MLNHKLEVKKKFGVNLSYFENRTLTLFGGEKIKFKNYRKRFKGLPVEERLNIISKLPDTTYYEPIRYVLSFDNQNLVDAC